MKKLILSILVVFGLMNVALSINMAVALEPTECATNPDSPLCQIQNVGEDTQLPNFLQSGQHPDAPANYLNPGAGTVTSPILFVIDIIRFVTSGIALLVIMIMAIRLVTQDNEDEAKKIQQWLLWAILGLILIQLASVLVKEMFFGDMGQAFEDEVSSEEFANNTVSQIRGLVGFIQIFVGIIAVLVIVARGVMLLVSAGDEDATNKAKTQIGYAIAGLVVVGISELVIRGVIFPNAGESLPDVNRGQNVIKMIVNFASGFVAITSFVMLFYAGYLYVASAGSEDSTDKVKKIFIGALIGLLLAMGAYAISVTLTGFERDDNSAPVSLHEAPKETIIT